MILKDLCALGDGLAGVVDNGVGVSLDGAGEVVAVASLHGLAHRRPEPRHIHRAAAPLSLSLPSLLPKITTRNRTQRAIAEAVAEAQSTTSKRSSCVAFKVEVQLATWKKRKKTDEEVNWRDTTPFQRCCFVQPAGLFALFVFLNPIRLLLIFLPHEVFPLSHNTPPKFEFPPPPPRLGELLTCAAKFRYEI